MDDTPGISIEWACEHAGILRVHRDPSGKLGDPYIWCCTLIRSDDAVRIAGVITHPPMRAVRPINDALYTEGLRYRTIVRRVGGSERITYKPIRPPKAR